ncbi:hypothetical protein CNR22_18260 [Sphingobacteriaceae bacterium]|nr:hypothetical protein CNR22_18260 [Sphingobacteriaceae bacterium]
MIRFLHSYGLPAVMALLIGLSNCGYQEQGHANTPPETPGSQVKTGVDTVVHPGNIDKDSIHLEK